MTIFDRVYGSISITEPVILELINAPTLQRLKEIDQSGYKEPFFPGSAHSRFEHSVGVYWLLNRYGASLEEQIAGLLHDVSHSAFSHCVDYALAEGSEGEQSHQDNIHDAYVERSEIPGILHKYGIDLAFILDDSHFPLKETTIPDLCADRIDYSLRGAIAYHLIDRDEAEGILAELAAEDGVWVFTSQASAKRFARLFLDLNDLYLADLHSAVMFRAVGDYLKRAISKRYISVADLYTTDKAVLAKIAPHHEEDAELERYFERMNNRIPFKNDPTDYDAKVVCKSRFVDPLCLESGEIVRLSSVDLEWKKIMQGSVKTKEYFLKFEK
ncbi:HD domain-containing protein [Patescibacteria group bacterium]|nr:HD domain-containing protein [Patescibacteria group bacterium]